MIQKKLKQNLLGSALLDNRGLQDQINQNKTQIAANKQGITNINNKIANIYPLVNGDNIVLTPQGDEKVINTVDNLKLASLSARNGVIDVNSETHFKNIVHTENNIVFEERTEGTLTQLEQITDGTFKVHSTNGDILLKTSTSEVSVNDIKTKNDQFQTSIGELTTKTQQNEQELNAVKANVETNTRMIGSNATAIGVIQPDLQTTKQKVEQNTTKINELIKEKKVKLSTRQYYDTWNSQGVRGYRYDFHNLGIDKSKVISAFFVLDNDTYDKNRSFTCSFVWLNSNKLCITITDNYTSADFSNEYNNYNLVIKYLGV